MGLIKIDKSIKERASSAISFIRINMMKLFIFAVLSAVVLLHNNIFVTATIINAPETTSAFNATIEFVSYYKYPIEEYDVQTSDGYILKFYRITGSPSSPPAPGKKAALLAHGFYTSSIDWVNLGPDFSLPYTLADAGYEVWLANLRGNTLSRRHVSLDPASAKFWDYTFHEVGLYDLTALIDFILATTGQSKVHYVGWSGGSAAFLAMGSERSAYMSKIASAHLLSPASFFTHAVSPPYRALSIWPGGFRVRFFSFYFSRAHDFFS